MKKRKDENRESERREEPLIGLTTILLNLFVLVPDTTIESVE